MVVTLSVHPYSYIMNRGLELDKTDFDLVFTDVELGDNRTGVDILK